MSAFQVSVDHIEAMLAAANHYGACCLPGSGIFSFCHDGERHCLSTEDDLAAFGRVLWETNAASVEARYPTERRGFSSVQELGLIPDLGEDFRFCPRRQRTPSPVEVLKLCACYCYQSCEFEAWESSVAAAFVNALEHCAIAALPGYDDAPWEWATQISRPIVP